MPQVQEIMSKNPVVLDASASVIDAARAMRDQEIGDVLVRRDDDLGIITDRDIVVRLLADGSDTSSATIGDATSWDLTVASPDEDAGEIVADMRRRDIRRVPVVEDGEPVGILSIGDMAMENDPDSALADISAAESNN